jgi:TonB family protein
MSSCPSHDPAGLLVPRREGGSSGRGGRGNERKASCAMFLVCCLMSFGGGPAGAQPEHDTSDRRLVTRVEPEYPETLQRLYIGGIVRLGLTISPKGTVENATLLGGNPILGQAAMLAVKKWKYAPASSRTATQVRINFDPHR